MFRILILCLAVILSNSLFAQNTYKVSGQLLDSASRQPLMGANVGIQSTWDEKITKGAITDEKGNFELELEPASYRISFSFVGYVVQKKRLFLKDVDVNLGAIYLAEDPNTVGTVEVEGRIPPVVMKGDTTEYNAAAFKTNPDATAGNLLEKMPGVTIQNGKIQAQGEDVKQVLVDGQPFFGDDPNAVLKNIPASMIDKVQIFDQQSEQSRLSGFDDGNTQKTINIISKPEYRTGKFGNAYAGYGNDFAPNNHKYKAGGVFNSFNNARRITLLGQSNNINEQNFSADDLSGIMSSGGGGRGGKGGGRGGWNGGNSNVGDFLVSQQNGISTTNAFGINYTDKWSEKIQVTASYFFNRTDNVASTSLYQQFLGRNEGQIYNEAEEIVSDNSNHRAYVRLTYNINEKNSIVFTPRFSMQINNGIDSLLGQTINNGELWNSTLSIFDSKVNAWTLSGSLVYNHRFEKKGRSFSTTLSNTNKYSKANSNLWANNYYSAQLLSDTLDQWATLGQPENNYSVNLEYTEPIGKEMQLSFSYQPSINLNDADKKTYSFDAQSNDYTSLDTILSNVSKNSYVAHAGGIGWRFNNKKLMLLGRAHVQYATLFTDQLYPTEQLVQYNFFSALPFVMVRYKINAMKNLRVVYRSNTTAPSITQLQEVLNNSNPLQLQIGNSELQQQFQNNLFIRYSAANPAKNSMFFAMIGGTYTNKYIGNSIFIAQRDTMLDNGVFLQKGTQLSQPVNVQNQLSLRAFSTYGVALKAIKSNFNVNASANYNRTPGLINGSINWSDNPVLGLGVVLSSNISEKVDFTLGTNSSLSYSINSLNVQQNTRFLNQNTTGRFYWNFWKTMVFRTDLSHQFYTGLSDGYNTSFLLWNASIATKLFKNKQGELAFMVYDILKQNNNISRNITETYIQDTQTAVLQRYFMLQFNYRIMPTPGQKEMMEGGRKGEGMKPH